jgi:DUF2075 family protein
MSRCYYHASISDFCSDTESSILGELTRWHQFALEEQQRNSWLWQIQLLKERLDGIEGHLAFEYSIPRMGKRIDCVVLSKGLIFAIEFKVGSRSYDSSAVDQVVDYALDLKNFHAESHHRLIIPVLVSTESPVELIELEFEEDGIAAPLLSNGNSLAKIIKSACAISLDDPVDAASWINSIYKPTPTIIEAAQALYMGHSVQEISRSDAGAKNLSRTAQAISDIIETSKKSHLKSICFLTGVPGSGKTLAGLNLANSWHQDDDSEHAVFLSGNGPLVEVLREALARNEVEVCRERGVKIRKTATLSKAKAFIQNIHHFRDDALESDKPPIERVVVFDEAQRAWTLKQTAAFMKMKKGKLDFNLSEPEFLIGVMDRHSDWATIVCLIGGGQEINTGEAGLHEWFDSLRKSFPHWTIHISDKLSDFEYTQGRALYSSEEAKRIKVNNDLHLAVSVRSFRSEKVSAFVKALLDCEAGLATKLYSEIKDSYPICLIRDIEQAKDWLRSKARGTERYGLVASSGALRLKPHGINVKYEIDPKTWFLNSKEDVRSSYYLEDVATEFDIQGLELDWVCVAWDADLRHNGRDWTFKAFRGTRWQDVRGSEARIYLLNAYRVLLTRARQGMIIFVPLGSDEDETRKPAYYDYTYNYLKSLGINEI